jgi:hypothetical protein
MQCDILFLRSVPRLLATANVRSSPILITLMTEAISFSEISDFTWTTRRNIPEDGIPHDDYRENLRSYQDYHLFGYLVCDTV